VDLQLSGLRALVGGGSRGLGLASARSLAAEGAAVALVARDPGRLAAAAHGIAGSGGRAVAIPADLSHPDGAATAVAGAVRDLGGLDCVVVNTGGPPPGRLETLDDAAWQAAFEGTLLSAVRLIRAALPCLRLSPSPAVVAITSLSVREPLPELLLSNALRLAVTGLLKSLARELAPIRVNAVAPGHIRTDRSTELARHRAGLAGTTVEAQMAEVARTIPLGRYGQPEELGRLVAFLCSPACGYLTGTTIPIDGGVLRSVP